MMVFNEDSSFKTDSDILPLFKEPFQVKKCIIQTEVAQWYHEIHSREITWEFRLDL